MIMHHAVFIISAFCLLSYLMWLFLDFCINVVPVITDPVKINYIIIVTKVQK